jgi:Polysaccharide deacetylase
MMGLTVRYFPLAGRFGSPTDVDEADVRPLAAAGMPVGSDGMHRPLWRRLDAESLTEELSVARSMIAEVPREPVTSVACPLGEYDRQVLAELCRHGYPRSSPAIDDAPDAASGCSRGTASAGMTRSAPSDRTFLRRVHCVSGYGSALAKLSCSPPIPGQRCAASYLGGGRCDRCSYLGDHDGTDCGSRAF